MACDHKRLRCTNGEFFCLDCGIKLRVATIEEIFPGGKKVNIPPVKIGGGTEEKPTKRKKKGA